MKATFVPMPKQRASDRLARELRVLIQQGDFHEGDRLPTIMEMAHRYRVGHPTVREALKTLEAIGIVEIRHGSGVYVSRTDEVLVLASPHYTGGVTKTLLLDLVRTRRPLEVESVAGAVLHATDAHLAEMHRLLAEAERNVTDDHVLHEANMGFHREIAVASGNTVLLQTLDVLREMFTNEQRMILGIFGPRHLDHQDHLNILEAIERRDAALAVERMRAHLMGVEEAVLRWDPDHNPVD